MRKIYYKKCLNCKKEFEFKAGSKRELESRKFCGWKCNGDYYSKQYSEQRIGKGNPMYKKIPWNFRGESWGYSGSKKKYKKIWVDGICYWEHRWVMEQKLGRKLKQNEIVHHIDHNCENNNPDNLVIMKPFEHSVYHGKLLGRNPNGTFKKWYEDWKNKK